MDAEKLRRFLLSLPHVEETMQWGDNLVFWVGNKAIGGRMFALANLDGLGKNVLAFSAGPERFAELVEIEGLSPSPYFARIHWVAMEHWNVLPVRDLETNLKEAHRITWEKLPRKTQALLSDSAKSASKKAVAAKRESKSAKQKTSVKPLKKKSANRGAK
jgi:predicted DNA-binding protein (MmcQ/YjbR family)